MVRLRAQEDVELNVAAMLDMAFQLLTFFILTFRVSPIEGQIALHMPGAPMFDSRSVAEERTPVEPQRTLTIDLLSEAGGIDSMCVAGKPVRSFEELRQCLAEYLQDRGSAFEQVVLQVSEALHYRELLRVMALCSEQTLADGSRLSKLSFASRRAPGADAQRGHPSGS
jgi:biopolymer transport protein ExbD